jgi:hypothetical protein
MNEFHLSCENGVCDTFIMLLLLPRVHHVLIMCSVHHVVFPFMVGITPIYALFYNLEFHWR